MTWLAVALGGSLGALTRYGISLQMGKLVQFPLATLVANVVGCFLAGWFYFAVVKRVSPEMGLFLTVGFLGALTTFSTFSVETLQLLQGGRAGAAVSSVALNVGLGLAGVWAGFLVGIRMKG